MSARIDEWRKKKINIALRYVELNTLQSEIYEEQKEKALE